LLTGRLHGCSQHRLMAMHHALQRFAGIHDQMKSIGYLRGRGSPLEDTVGVRARTVTGHHRNAGMSSQPFGQSVGLAIGQQIDHGVALSVDQNRTVALMPFPGPIIDAEYTRGRGIVVASPAQAT